MPQWPSRRNCPQSIHGRVSAHPAIRRKKNTATLKINIFPARKEIFCKFLQYMLSNTFLQHKRLSVHIQQKKTQYQLVFQCSRLQSCKDLQFQSAPLVQESLLCWSVQPDLQSVPSCFSCMHLSHHTSSCVWFQGEGEEAAMT